MLVVVAACSYDEQGELAVTLGDDGRYLGLVQPVVGPRCATLDCHGDAMRPLALFAENGLRMSAELRGQSLSVAETRANVVAIATIDPDATPSESLVLLKPLAVDGGGMKHVGGDVWDVATDPAHVCLLGWLDGDDSADWLRACEDAQFNN